MKQTRHIHSIRFNLFFSLEFHVQHSSMTSEEKHAHNIIPNDVIWNLFLSLVEVKG